MAFDIYWRHHVELPDRDMLLVTLRDVRGCAVNVDLRELFDNPAVTEALRRRAERLEYERRAVEGWRETAVPVGARVRTIRFADEAGLSPTTDSADAGPWLGNLEGAANMVGIRGDVTSPQSASGTYPMQSSTDLNQTLRR